MRLVIKVWKETFNLLARYPRIVIPFIIAAALNAAALYLLFLAPQRPVSYLLAPPIRVFFGEKFLHYPFNLFLLPKLFYYAQVCVSASIGVLMLGMAISMLSEAHRGMIPRIFSNLGIAFKRYFSLFAVWGLLFLFNIAFLKLVQITNWNEKISLAVMPYFNYFVAVFIQILFIYTMPALIIEKKKIFSAIKSNFSTLIRFFFPTVILALVPSFLYIPIIFIRNTSMPSLIQRYKPDVILFVLGASIFISFIIDFFLTIFPTLVFLRNENLDGYTD